MDGEKFYEELHDAVVNVRAALVAADTTTAGTAENLRSVIDVRRNRDQLTTLIARYPEEFAGLLLALAASANETYAGVNDRLAKLETAMFDSQDNIDSPLGYLASRVEYLGERLDNAGVV